MHARAAAFSALRAAFFLFFAALRASFSFAFASLKTALPAFASAAVRFAAVSASRMDRVFAPLRVCFADFMVGTD